MNDTLAAFLWTLLSWWTVLFVGYAALLFALDALLSAWKHRQQGIALVEVARAYRDVVVAVGRIVIAMVLAQRLIRQEAAARRGGRP